MGKFNFDKEWEFVVAEVHKGFRVEHKTKRQILFFLQILLDKREVLNYMKLKRLYKN